MPEKYVCLTPGLPGVCCRFQYTVRAAACQSDGPLKIAPRKKQLTWADTGDKIPMFKNFVKLRIS